MSRKRWSCDFERAAAKPWMRQTKNQAKWRTLREAFTSSELQHRDDIDGGYTDT